MRLQFAQAIRGREHGKDDHAAARASIEGALLSGLDAVRKLDVLVANRLRGDPVTMAVWERDRHIESSRRARRSVSPARDAPVIAPAVPEPAAAPADAGDIPSRVAS